MASSKLLAVAKPQLPRCKPEWSEFMWQQKDVRFMKLCRHSVSQRSAQWLIINNKDHLLRSGTGRAGRTWASLTFASHILTTPAPTYVSPLKHCIGPFCRSAIDAMLDLILITSWITATTSEPISSASHSLVSPACVVPTAYVINHGVTALSKAVSCDCGFSLSLCCLLKKAKLSLVSSVLWNLPEP